MTAQAIYDQLRAAGMTRAGAIGSVANMMAEAGPQLRPNQVQLGMTSLTNEQYTAAVDKGYLNFEDGCGFGLCQWTAGQRKNWLLSFAKKSGVSVGDGEMQVEFFLWELREYYPGLWEMLCTSEDVNTCTDRICDTYERPAVNNYAARRKFAAELEKTIRDVTPVGAIDPIVLALQGCMFHDGYIEQKDVTGVKDQKFRETLPIYAADVVGC
jgi:hypothetical protein